MKCHELGISSLNADGHAPPSGRVYRSGMSLVTSFTELVGCRVPIQQAPMGSVSTPALAVAVADEGGVGTITALGMTADQLDALLGDMAARTTGVLGANFLTASVDRDAVAAAASRVRLVDFFWSDPDPSLVEIAHRGGALACWQVGSVEEAQAAADAGCDVIAVQGTEAGGHVRGYSPLLPLLESALDALTVPVLAAGGIGDGRAFAAVLSKGAAGARVGTRFVATEESGAHPLYKQAVVGASAGSTEITDAFSICPLCATVPRARVVRSCIHAVRRLTDDEAGDTVMGGARIPVAKGHGLPPSADALGHIDAMAMYAGESVAAIDAIEPVAHIIGSWCVTAEGRAST
ncbi:MAG TPA: nitronate monooxygenase [Acidimicrobiales bacterium]